MAKKFKYATHDCATCLKKAIEDVFKVKIQVPKYACKASASKMLKKADADPVKALIALIKQALAPHKLTLSPLQGSPKGGREVVLGILSPNITVDGLPSIAILDHGLYKVLIETGKVLHLQLKQEYLVGVYQIKEEMD